MRHLLFAHVEGMAFPVTSYREVQTLSLSWLVLSAERRLSGLNVRPDVERSCWAALPRGTEAVGEDNCQDTQS